MADTIGYDWFTLTASSGIIASVFSVAVNSYVRSRDEKERKRKMLYHPLFLACEGIIEVVTNYKSLGDSRSRQLFISNTKMLDEIYSNHEMIYLEGEDLHKFLKLKKAIDVNFEYFEKRNWEYLEDLFESEDFEDIKESANNLLSICQREVKELRNLPGEIE